MKEKPIKVPGPDHPISIEHNPSRVVVSVASGVIADTGNALALREADYPPVQYIPREDADLSQLKRTDHATYCPYKGDCTYYSVPSGGEKSVNAVWTYENRILLLRRSRDTSPSTPTESMKSRSNFQRSVSRQRAVIPNQWRKLL